RHFTARQKQTLGDLKSTIAIDQELLRDTDNVPGTKGFIFLASRELIQALILAGDVAQADGYMGCSLARFVEIRTSSHPEKPKWMLAPCCCPGSRSRANIIRRRPDSSWGLPVP